MGIVPKGTGMEGCVRGGWGAGKDQLQKQLHISYVSSSNNRGLALSH